MFKHLMKKSIHKIEKGKDCIKQIIFDLIYLICCV